MKLSKMSSGLERKNSYQTAGGVRPARRVSDHEEAVLEKGRRCGTCLKKCVSQPMWTCCSGKAVCKDMMFHRKCLAKGIGMSLLSGSRYGNGERNVEMCATFEWGRKGGGGDVFYRLRTIDISSSSTQLVCAHLHKLPTESNRHSSVES